MRPEGVVELLPMLDDMMDSEKEAQLYEKYVLNM